MFVRRTQTRRTDGQTYYTHRLVHSERIGSKVRQRTLLNLGGHFEVPREQWPGLCQRIDEIRNGQAPLLDDTPPALEEEAQRIAAQLLARTPVPAGESPDDAAPGRDLQSVDVDSLDLVRPRSVGVEQVGLSRIRHQLPAADADALALRGRAPSSRFDVLSSTPASSSGPRD